MAGQISMIFYMVKLGTGRFVIKYSTIGYMTMSGGNSWGNLWTLKKEISRIVLKLASSWAIFERSSGVSTCIVLIINAGGP